MNKFSIPEPFIKFLMLPKKLIIISNPPNLQTILRLASSIIFASMVDQRLQMELQLLIFSLDHIYKIMQSNYNSHLRGLSQW